MRLSIHTARATGETLEGALKLAADAGLDAVDIVQADDGVHLPNGAPPEQGQRCRTLVAEYGLRISGLTTFHRLGHADAAVRDVQMAGIASSMELAAAMGAEYFLISGPAWDPQAGYERQRQITREQAGQIAQMAADHDLIVTVEQHGAGLTASAGQILDLFRGIPTDNFGVVFDPGNCLREGYERPLVQVDMLGDMIKAVHVKNMMTRSAEPPQEYIPYEPIRLDRGILDWPQIVKAIIATGYDGYFTIEDFSEFDSLAEKFTWNVDYLRAID